jgi:hypothetical protein
VKSSDLSQWKSEAGPIISEKTKGVVIAASKDKIKDIAEQLEPVVSGIPILSLSVPFSLENGAPVGIPSSSKVPIALSMIYTRKTPEAVEVLKWALEQGYVVDMDVQFDNDESAYESLEDTLGKASENGKENSAIVLSNILPPADDLTLSLVKLINHPTYRAYQAHTASLSLIPNTYIKFIPPSWKATTPQTPAPGGVKQEDSSEKKAWKRRIKMYIGPALEAFGYQRIIFGSSPSVSSHGESSVNDWYELARESFAELGIEQEGIDAIFYENAKQVYGSSGK